MLSRNSTADIYKHSYSFYIHFSAEIYKQEI
jgi:hypothetical protein